METKLPPLNMRRIATDADQLDEQTLIAKPAELTMEIEANKQKLKFLKQIDGSLQDPEKTKAHSLRYNDGKLKWSYIDRKSLEPMIRVLMYGAHKYTTFLDQETGLKVAGKDLAVDYDRRRYKVLTSGVDNWKLDFEIPDLIDSLERHVTEYCAGEENDVESGLSHIGHMLCNIMFISYHASKGKKFKRS